jgi:DNA-binding transcriptional MerR regulator
VYTPQTVDLLRFIKQAKTLGFTLTEIREIIALLTV